MPTYDPEMFQESFRGPYKYLVSRGWEFEESGGGNFFSKQVNGEEHYIGIDNLGWYYNNGTGAKWFNSFEDLKLYMNGLETREITTHFSDNDMITVDEHGNIVKVNVDWNETGPSGRNFPRHLN